MQLCFEKFIHKKENVPPDRQNVNRSDAKLLLFPPFAFSWLQGELQHRERGGNCLQCCVFHMGCQWRSQGEGGGCMCHTMEAEQVRRRKLLALCGEDCLIKAQVFVFRTPGLCWTAVSGLFIPHTLTLVEGSYDWPRWREACLLLCVRLFGAAETPGTGQQTLENNPAQVSTQWRRLVGWRQIAHSV